MDYNRIRKSPRAKWHNYSGGIYFVTVVTKDRIPFFGKIQNHEIELSLIGKYLQQDIEDLGTHYPYAKVLKYVVMPNHFHLLLLIDPQKTPKKKRNLDTLNNDAINKYTVHETQSWLSIIIGGIKSYVTKFAIKSSPEFGWQERYHDHIIRGEEDFKEIGLYIDSNVMLWDNDCFHPSIDEKSQEL